MSQLGSESCSNMKPALQKIKEQNSRKQTSSDTFVHRVFTSSTYTKPISRKSSPTMTSATKALVLVYQIQVIGETNMSEEK